MANTSIVSYNIIVISNTAPATAQPNNVFAGDFRLMLRWVSLAALKQPPPADAVLAWIDDARIVQYIRRAYSHQPIFVMASNQMGICSDPDVFVLSVDTLNHATLTQVALQLQVYEQRLTLDTINNLAQSVQNIASAEETINALFDATAQIVPYTGANITLIDEGMLRMAFERGYSDQAVVSVQSRALHASQLDGSLLTIRQPLLVTDTAQQDNWLTVPELAWVRSWIGVPIYRGGEVIGMLNFDGEHPHQFNALHLRRIAAIQQSVGALIQAVLQNRAFHVLRAINRQHSFLYAPLSTQTNMRDLCQTIADTVVGVFGKADCGVLLVDTTQNELVRFARAGEYHVTTDTPLYLNGDGLAVQAANTGQVVYAPDVRQMPNYMPNEPRTRSELVVPLLCRAGLVGVLDLQSAELDAFTYQDREVLTAFAEHAATAIHNLQLFNRERDNAVILEARVEERTAALNQARMRAEAILNRVNDAIAVLNPDGEIEQTNGEFNDLFDAQPDVLYGLPVMELASGSQRDYLLSLIERVQQHRHRQTIETVMGSQGGRHFDAEVTLSLVNLHDGARSDMVCSIRDISRHKTIEMHLRRALETEREMSELKSRFIATVTHQFRTPLTVILSSSELLHGYGEKMKPERREQHFQNIIEQVNQMEEMLSNALLVGRAERDEIAFNPAPLDAAALCKRVIQKVTTSAEIGAPPVHLYVTGGDMTLYADSTLLEQVVTNLLTNAQKYAGSSESIDISLNADAQQLTLQIEDSGLGIPADDITMIFQPFFRASNVSTYTGSGLGLSIVKYAVERHSGSVHVESTEGMGTRFTVTLPRTTGKAIEN